jgi:DNA repair exonuclease SbcCD ATPase subunit
MVEPIMYIAIGFLVASLLAVMLLPLVHKRAVRLTTRRIEAATPLSIAEIQAEKDHLRAENAMAMRRLEMLVEETKAKAAAQFADIGKKAESIHRLKVEVEEKGAAIARLESSEKSLQEQLQQTQAELADRTAALRETQKTLSEKEKLLAKVSAELDQQSGTADYQRIEIAALQTHIADLKGHVGEFEKAIKHGEERLSRERSEATAATAELAAERAKTRELMQRVTALETELAGKTAELGAVAAAEAADGDKEGVQQELAALRMERDRLQQRVAVLEQQTEVGGAAERVENEMLRERINDVAAEVTKLTLLLEAEASPIPSLLAEGTGHAGANGSSKETTATGHGSLADRIRALQARASAAANTSTAGH